MNEKQILKERKIIRKTVTKDDAIEVVIRLSESSSDKFRDEIESEVESSQQIQHFSDIKEQREETNQEITLESIEQSKTVEISIIQPTFQEIVEIKANTTSRIQIPEYRDVKMSHIHPVKFQILKPTPIEIRNVAVELEIPETSVARALKSVRERMPEPEFERPKEISIAEVNAVFPEIDRTTQILLNFVTIVNAVTSVKPSEVKIKTVDALCHVRSTTAPSAQDIVVEEFEDPIENTFGSASFKVLSERPIIILAEKPEDENLEYIEFLKRILREVYRVRAGGLPAPTHISTDFEEIKLDVKADRSIYVIDLDKANVQSKQYLIDRIKELYSQNFGFVVLYGSKSSINTIKDLWKPELTMGLSKLPKYVEVKVDNREDIFMLANLFWGFIEKVMPDEAVNLDEYVIKFEEYFYSKIEENANDIRSALIVEPSREDEEGLKGESIIHYGIKAFIVDYLMKFEKIPLENIQTELEFGDAIIDVFVRHPEHGDIAIEVETLYGTTIPMLKLKKRIESRLRKGLKTWIVIPNPQFIIYFKEISALRSVYRKKYKDAVEFWTLDVKTNRLVSFNDVARLIKNNVERLKLD